MAICGNVASLGWEDLIPLLLDNGLQGTLTILGGEGSLDLLLQGGLILLPIPPDPAFGRSREEHRKRANRALSKALAWRWASFEFVPGRIPEGFVARRSLVLKPARLLEAIDLLRAQRARRLDSSLPPLERFPLKGSLEGVGLPAILRALHRGRRTGTLQIFSDRCSLEVVLVGGSAHLLERSLLPRWMADPSTEQRRLTDRVLRACLWEGASFRFAPDSLPEAFRCAPPGVYQIELDTPALLEAAFLQAQHLTAAPAWSARPPTRGRRPRPQKVRAGAALSW